MVLFGVSLHLQACFGQQGPGLFGVNRQLLGLDFPVGVGLIQLGNTLERPFYDLSFLKTKKFDGARIEVKTALSGRHQRHFLSVFGKHCGTSHAA